MLTILANCRGGIPIDTEIKLGNETDGTKHAERVLVESLARVPHRAQEFVLYVLLTVIGIDKVSFRLIERYSIDCEVPPCEVLFERFPPFHLVRSALVRVFRLSAIRGYLDDSCTRILTLGLHAHGAIVILVERLRKYGLYLLRNGIRRHIPVLRLPPDDEIANTPAHEVCFEAGLPEAV